MTIPDLVQRIKNLPADTSAKQVEKFVTELLGQPKKGEVMFNYYKRRVLARLKRLRE